MRKRFRQFCRFAAIAFFLARTAFCQTAGDQLPLWSPGTLDIHQIQTGRGDATFLVFPDGATLLIDAGAVPDRPGPQLGPQHPNASRTPGEWIAQYIRQFSPHTGPTALDYALLTHYHDDHIAAIAAVARSIPIRTLLDRGDNPAPAPSLLMENYRKFRKVLQADMKSSGPAGSIRSFRTPVERTHISKFAT